MCKAQLTTYGAEPFQQMRRLRLTRPRAWALFTAGKSLDFIPTHSLTWFSPDNAPPGLCPNGLWASCRPRMKASSPACRPPCSSPLSQTPQAHLSRTENPKPRWSTVLNPPYSCEVSGKGLFLCWLVFGPRWCSASPSQTLSLHSHSTNTEQHHGQGLPKTPMKSHLLVVGV